MSRYILLMFFFGFVGCASIKPPPGGPEDKTPPSLDTVMPHQGSLNVPRDAKLHFIFTQNIDRTSFTSALSVTPYLSGPVKYSWSGYDEVVVTLPEQLRENTTYVVSLTKDLKTRRNAPLTGPIQIVFSTGNIIDSGHISGSILPPLNAGAPTELNNISLFAYDISTSSVDTLEFNKTRPDFITEPNSKGDFEFKAVKVGHTYRIFAIRDEFRNKVFDPGIDAYGAANRDVTLNSQENSDLRIRMAPKSDSVKPLLQDAEVVNAYHIRVRFTEAVDSASVKAEAFILTDSITGDIPIIAAFRENIDRRPGAVTLLTAKPLETDHKLSLDVISDLVHDLAGNPVSDSSQTQHFSASTIRDTFPPPRFLGFEFADSSKGIPQALDLDLSFTDAVDTAILRQGLHLTDSANKEKNLLWEWVDGTKLRLRSIGNLLPNTFYKLLIEGKSVVSPVPSYASKVVDTLYQFRFFTGDEREFGTVSGEVEISDSILSAYPNAVITIQLLIPGTTTLRTLSLPLNKRTYVFEHVQRGKYIVRGWLNAKNDGKYDPGSIIPFRFGAPSGEYPDQIDVRAKWTVEKVNFEIR